MNNKLPTEEEIEKYYQYLVKNDPKAELRQEFGKMLLRNIDSFNEVEIERYNYLKKVLGES